MNIHVDEGTDCITGIVDWANAIYTPFVHHSEVLKPSLTSRLHHTSTSILAISTSGRSSGRLPTKVTKYLSENDRRAIQIRRLFGMFQTYGFSRQLEKDNAAPLKEKDQKFVYLEAFFSLSTTDLKRRCSDQEGSMMEDTISPQSQFNSVAQRGSLGSLNSLKLMVDIQTDQHVAGNKPGVTQASRNSIFHPYPNKSTNDVPALNCVGVNPPTPRSGHIIGTQPPRTGNTEEQWHDRAGFEWSDFNA
ncbi:hypothetical protein B7463_g5188, partial [Scytalidium lignicola]